MKDPRRELDDMRRMSDHERRRRLNRMTRVELVRFALEAVRVALR